MVTIRTRLFYVSSRIFVFAVLCRSQISDGLSYSEGPFVMKGSCCKEGFFKMSFISGLECTGRTWTSLKQQESLFKAMLHTHKQTHTHTHKQTNTHTQTHTHSHTHTHTHTYVYRECGFAEARSNLFSAAHAVNSTTFRFV